MSFPRIGSGHKFRTQNENLLSCFPTLSRQPKSQENEKSSYFLEEDEGIRVVTIAHNECLGRVRYCSPPRSDLRVRERCSFAPGRKILDTIAVHY